MRGGAGAAASGLGFIGVGFFVQVFVNHRLGDDVPLGGPVAEVEQAAALATERKVRVRPRIRRLLADGAAMFHVVSSVIPSAARNLSALIDGPIFEILAQNT